MGSTTLYLFRLAIVASLVLCSFAAVTSAQPVPRVLPAEPNTEPDEVMHRLRSLADDPAALYATTYPPVPPAYRSGGPDDYYTYTPAGKYYLPVSTERALVKFRPGVSLERQRTLLAAYSQLLPLEPTMFLPAPVVTLAHFVAGTSASEVRDVLRTLGQLPEVAYAHPFLEAPDGVLLGIQDGFQVGLNNNNLADLQRWARLLGVTIEGAYPYDESIYLLRAGESGLDALTAANLFFESGRFAFAEPDFLLYGKLQQSTDPLVPYQWALQNSGGSVATAGADMNVPAAWSITTGSSAVRVAVIDSGVELFHPDLAGNLLSGYDAVNLGSNGGPAYGLHPDNAHGTASAGLVAARGNNGMGVAGVAYNSKIVPVRYGYVNAAGITITTNQVIANALNWSWDNGGADILSNSWGGGLSSSLVNSAIENAVSNGRGGKGSIVLFAAGNDNGGVSYPAIHGWTIAVGATSYCDERKSPFSCDGVTNWGSNYGAGLDIAAPGVFIMTTDLVGPEGYSNGAAFPNDPAYTAYYGGTSAACPNAAGVAALILSVGPELTGAEARFILEYSCDKTGGYFYQDDAENQPVSSWSTELGYGRVNAGAAVQLADAYVNSSAVELEMATSMQVSPSPIVQGEPGAAVFNIRNTGSSDFFGELVVALHDTNGENGEIISGYPNVSLCSGCIFSDNVVFNFNVTNPPGQYLLVAWYREADGEWTELSDGAYNNIKSVNIVAPTIDLSLTPGTLNVNPASSSAAVSVNSNCGSWTATSSAGWLSVSPASGSNNGALTVNYPANPTTQARTATITVAGCGASRTVQVTQSGAAVSLSVSPGQLSPGAGAGTAQVNVSSNCGSWTATSSAGWLSVSPASGGTNGSLTVNYGANPGTQSRTATITVAGCGESRTVQVTQSGAAVSLSVSPGQLSPGAGSGTASLSVSSNCGSWTATSSAGWLSVSPASGANNGTLTVSYVGNPGTQSRTATITVAGCGQSRTVTVTQSGAAVSLSVSPGQLSPGAGAGTAQVNVSSNCGSWTATSSAGWLSVSPASGGNNGSLTVNYGANPGTQSRTATITVAGCGESRTVQVTQSGAAVSLSVSPGQLSPGAGSGTASLSVSSNCGSWTATSSVGWLSVSPASGANNGSLQVSYGANASTQSRTATITVAGCGESRTVQVTQSGAAVSLSVSPGQLSPGAGAGTAQVSVSSNCGSWTATSSAGWLSVSPASGGNNGSLTVNYGANSGTQSRTATITVAGCGQSRQVQVTQVGVDVEYPWTAQFTGPNHTVIIPATAPITIDGEPLVPGDLIGFFFERDGMLHCSNFLVWEGVNTSLPVYGNDADAGEAKNGFATDEAFKIKVYRTQEQTEYLAQASYAPVGTQGVVSHTDRYASDGISMLLDLAATSSQTLDISLSAGWNTISSYVAPSEPELLGLLSSIADEVVLLKDQVGQSVIPVLNLNNIGNWNATEGYQIKVRNATTLSMSGSRVDPAQTNISIQTGWQIVSYLHEQPGPIATQLAGIADRIEIVKNNAGQAYIPALGIDNIGQLLPTQGYKLKASAPGTLVYPANLITEPVAVAKSGVAMTPQHFGLDSTLNTGNNSLLVFPASSVAHFLQPGDEIGVFTSAGTLCGAAVYTGENFAVTVWGDDPTTTDHTEGMQAGEAYTLYAWAAAADAESLLSPSFSQGDAVYQADDVEFIEFVDIVNATAEVSSRAQPLRVYPNPAGPVFTVEWPENAAYLELYDASGRLLRRAVSTGGLSQEIATAGLPRGVLLVTVVDTSGHRRHARLILR